MPVPVLYLITELSTGGAQIALLHLLRNLDRGRFSPTVACLYNGDGAVAQEMRTLGIQVFDARMRHKADLIALLRLYRHLRRVRPALLHTSLFHANLSGRILGWLASIPIIICSERTMAMESAWRYRFNRWTIGLVDRVIAVSAAVRDFCAAHIGLPTEKLTLIHNGVPLPEAPPVSRQETRLALGLPPEGTIIGAVNRLDPVKGVGLLLRAFTQVASAFLVIIGDGPERVALESLASRLGLGDRVRWAGYQQNVSRWLPAFDLLAQPSLYEGLPNTVLEAMAASLPVVATAVGGTPEVVVDGVTGLLVPPRNPDALAQGITRLLRDPDLRRKMGQEGRERVEQHFSIEETVRQTEALYEALLREKGY
jgi:glycosyltransferase involved in cell wall biosynthesis